MRLRRERQDKPVLARPVSPADGNLRSLYKG